MATFTEGRAGVPSSKLVNLDHVYAQSLPGLQKVLIDTITSNNPLWFKMKENGMYTSEDGGTHIETFLKYENAKADTYANYDVLSILPTDGVTSAIYQWRNASVPIVFSYDEQRRNAKKIFDLIETKMDQAKDGLAEFIPTMFLQGNGNGALDKPYVSVSNSSLGVDPLAKLVSKSQGSDTIGNIATSNKWWQNGSTSSTATKYDGLLEELDMAISKTSIGVGGRADLIITDLTTYQLLKFAIFKRTQYQPSVNADFPFENVTWYGTPIVWDEKIPDVENDKIVTDASDSKGTIYLLNTKNIEFVYDSETDFKASELKTPPNQNAKVGHIFWRGNLVVNNRRKHHVIYNIARSLTS